MIGLVRNNLIVLMIVLHTSNIVFSQDQDSSSTLISSTSKQIEQIGDSTVTEEDSPLDIGKDRGLFIITSDGKMQLRILGSVRFSLLYDMIETPIKKTFNTYYIPTGEDNIKVPNYYNSLNDKIDNNDPIKAELIKLYKINRN